MRRGLWIGKKCAALEASKSFYVLPINSPHPSLCLTQESSFKSLITFYTHCLYRWQCNLTPHIKSRQMETVVDTTKNIAVQTGRDDISVIILLQFKCHKTPKNKNKNKSRTKDKYLKRWAHKSESIRFNRYNWSYVRRKSSVSV